MSSYKVGDVASLFPLPHANDSKNALQSLFNQHYKKNIKFKTRKELEKSLDIETGVLNNANKKKSTIIGGIQNFKKPKLPKFEESAEFIRTKKKKQKQNVQLKVPDTSNEILQASFEPKNKVNTNKSFRDFKNIDKQSKKLKRKRTSIEKSDNIFVEYSSEKSGNIFEEYTSEKSENIFDEYSTKKSKNIFNEHLAQYSKSEKSVKNDSEKKFVKSYDEEEYLPCTLFVGNLPMSITIKKLKKLFRTFGVLKTCRFRGAVSADSKVPEKAAAIMNKLHEGMKNQIGYVVFNDRESATAALSLNGTVVDNHHIIVNFAARSGEKKLYENDLSIFIGNLPFDVDEETVWTAFQPHGDVQAVRIIRDRVTGLGKGFGYVQFKDSVSKNNVLKMNSLEIKEREIRIKAIDNNSNRKLGSKDSLKMIRSNLASKKSRKPGNKKSVKKLLKKGRLVHNKKQIASKLGQKFVK